MNILVTGGAGFIGSNFIRLMLKKQGQDVRIINVDCLSYAGHLETTSDFSSHTNYQFYKADITNKPQLQAIFEAEAIEAVVHFAAESHVDRSIMDSTPFVLTNVLGTQVLLDLAKAYKVKRFLHVSTDEVYGALGPEGAFTEQTPLAPNSPYSASKAASDLLVRSYCNTFGFPGLISRCSNNYGPFQLPEKLIPLALTKAQSDQPIPVYGQGAQIRDWLYVIDHCDALALILEKGAIGEVYNVGGGQEMTNLALVKKLLMHLNKPETLITYVSDRLGHDFRYAIDHQKLTHALGWTPKVNFEEGLTLTIDWYRANSSWVSAVSP